MHSLSTFCTPSLSPHDDELAEQNGTRCRETDCWCAEPVENGRSAT